MPDPRLDRQRNLLLYLRVAGIVALVCAAGGAALPGEAGTAAAGAAIATLVGAPLVRVVWLALRWAARRDWRYSAAAVVVVAVAASGAVLG